MIFVDVTDEMREELQGYSCWCAPLNAKKPYTIGRIISAQGGKTVTFWCWSPEFMKWMNNEFGPAGERWQLFAGITLAFRNKDDAVLTKLKWDD